MEWTNNVDSARNMNELKSSNFTFGSIIPDFDIFDKKDCKCSQEVAVDGFQEASLHGRAQDDKRCYMIYDLFKLSGSEQALLNSNDTIESTEKMSTCKASTPMVKKLLSVTKGTVEDTRTIVAQETSPLSLHSSPCPREGVIGTKQKTRNKSHYSKRIEPYHGIELARNGAEQGTSQLCSTETSGPPLCGAVNKGQQLMSMLATKRGLFKVLQHAEGNPKGKSRKHQKKQWEGHKHRPTIGYCAQVNVREKTRAASGTFLRKVRRKSHSPSQKKREKRHRWGKREILKGKGPRKKSIFLHRSKAGDDKH